MFIKRHFTPTLLLRFCQALLFAQLGCQKILKPLYFLILMKARQKILKKEIKIKIKKEKINKNKTARQSDKRKGEIRTNISVNKKLSYTYSKFNSIYKKNKKRTKKKYGKEMKMKEIKQNNQMLMRENEEIKTGLGKAKKKSRIVEKREQGK